ncbi:Ger(x)C family spore germination protein [Bacillus cereus]|uniref:Ger(x)C family spore germination protein n=1 Tax=Bacillus cereus TaxID=1396 RepID=UPI000BFC36CC|nr:Ger(x)C family spore germination protein [Bacillus cereus]PGP94702.1 spore gernimation protein GerH [Bacillus cereus]PGS49145.1 spore gernimation protein GerH [Bacillus cereus]PGU91375.1 spore gernimation protein GerH [Bacillus cereus]
MRKFLKMKIIFICISMFLLTGCLQKSIIDDVQLIQGAVFDTAKEKIKTTVVCPTQKKGHYVQIFENIANTVRQGKESFSLKSPRPFVSGQLRVALFTKRLMKKDLTLAMDTLLRDSSIGHMMYLGVLEGTGYELFNGKYNNNFNVAIYIKYLLEHNMESGSLPYSNLHLDAYRYYQDGQDNFMPILKKQKNQISITGLALFNKKKYVGELKSAEMFVFRGLLEKHKLASKELKIHGGHVLINSIDSTPSYQIQFKNEKPHIYIQVILNARLVETTQKMNLEKKKSLEVLTKNIEQQLNTESKKITNKIQRLNVDPLGLGAKVKQKYRQFNLNEWRNMYKDVPINVKYIVKLRNTGIVE